MLHALIDDSETVIGERNIDPPTAVKPCANGRPRLRPIVVEAPILGPGQKIAGHNYAVGPVDVVKIYTVADASPGEVAEIRRQKAGEVDAAAEAERLKYITPGYGQMLTYQEKAREAERFALLGEGGAPYPLLSAEIGITGADLAAVAAVITARHNAFKGLGAAIERARLTAKQAIDQAATPAEIAAISFSVAAP